MTGLDTNIIVRFIMQDDSIQSPIATRLFDSFSPDAPAYICAIALIETVWVLRSTYDANREHIQRVLDILLRSRGVMVERSDLVWMALRASSEGSADFGDYLIEQLGAAAGCDCTVTFDRDASKSARMKLLR